MLKNFLVLLLISNAFGCKPRSQREHSGVDALPQARAIIGRAQAWSPLAIDPKRVNRSMAERRKAAWSTVEQALTRVEIINPKTHRPFIDQYTGKPLTLPLWQTWYEVNEFRTMMFQLWDKLTVEQRTQKSSSPELVEEIMANHHFSKLLKKWTDPRANGKTKFEQLLSQINGNEAVAALNGVSGSGYTLFSPEMVRHYLLHYGDVLACKGTPPEFTTGVESKDFGTCLGDAFPKGAAAIKATWSNVNAPISSFDTSASGLAKMLSKPKPTWHRDTAVALSTPGPSEIYTSSTFEDENLSPSFRLTGLHIITKDIPEWMWITLWWSPNSNSAFGEDRPAALNHLGPHSAEGVWSHYKMCVVSTFDEEDQTSITHAQAVATESLLASTDTSLAAALASSNHFSAPQSFCSNPYIEFAHGNTNCIGCHQLAGLMKSGAKVDSIRERARKSFMTDFTWSFDSPTESFRNAIEDVVIQ
jgi:hypothetical protein